MSGHRRFVSYSGTGRTEGIPSTGCQACCLRGGSRKPGTRPLGSVDCNLRDRVAVEFIDSSGCRFSLRFCSHPEGARVQDVIAQAIKHKRVALVSSLLNVAALARETHEEEGQEGQEGSPGRASEKEENDEGDVGLELLSEVLDRAVGEVRDMEADLSAKEMLVVLGKVVYGAEQWAKVDARIKSLHPVSQPPEYKKFVLKGFQDLAEKKREQEAKKQQRRKQHARLDSDYEDMLDLCSDEEDDFSPTVTGAVTEVDTAGVTTTVTK